MTEERKIEKFGVGNLYPDRNPPEFHFFSSCIDVEMSDGDGFSFTPFFNEFKDTDDIDKYLDKYIEDKKVEKLDVKFEFMSWSHYYINPETLELEDFIKDEIRQCERQLYLIKEQELCQKLNSTETTNTISTFLSINQS